ncbi:response regulator transcription factor [Brevibacillus sp. RS1.1]|uniref:Two-component response regulator n=1 Tax=Brevibacillus brevis (strain 47 / JCM 6285 / NBRC 100599) TaxID=358681 RepID=C0ZDX7_BREBN|nr:MULTISPECIES: response regulator transcription factor [Bacillales]NRR05695.1 response regulator transcription factor [Brevibacillus sp. RS1.1]TQR36909.1 response regulator transcription factor [Lysinibacillus sp. SDF0063]UIO40036.1 response regulator transcription factor [Brevibacillus brevis]BAH43986.1 two-component response regulator [Brevibacillus brevis NBRC 100599]
MRVLLAEDQLLLGKIIAHMLKEKGGHDVKWVTNGQEAYNLIIDSYYDVLVLDWMMPQKDGVTLCKELREQGYSGAILMLTAKDTLEERIEGLDAGADDYLVKPFESDELLARLRALSRRNFAPIQEDIIEVNGIRMNRSKQSITRDGEEIQLTGKEFALLDLLVRNQGTVLTRDLILDRIWGGEMEVASNSVDVYITLLRKKIDAPSQKPLIRSIRGVGYVIEKS